MERMRVTLEGTHAGGCPGLEPPVSAGAQRGPDLELGEPVSPGGCNSVSCVTRTFASQGDAGGRGVDGPGFPCSPGIALLAKGRAALPGLRRLWTRGPSAQHLRPEPPCVSAAPTRRSRYLSSLGKGRRERLQDGARGLCPPSSRCGGPASAQGGEALGRGPAGFSTSSAPLVVCQACQEQALRTRPPTPTAAVGCVHWVRVSIC